VVAIVSNHPTATNDKTGAAATNEVETEATNDENEDEEDGEIIKGSIRSESNKNIDVRNIAKLFGGGGHTLASGFTLKGKLSSTNNSWHVTN
jgi:nanoRNase/pAp phosphatase (c-di-AMP/oligoRNAs hydrolase)